NNIGVTAISDPSFPINPGTHPVKVSIKNIGTVTLTSADINWSVNGVLQTPYSWTGSVISGATETTVNIGSFNFTSPLPYEITAWTTNPNGVTDENPDDDTIT